MPYADPEKEREQRRRYYRENRERWKNPDGTWKKTSNYGTDEFRASRRAHYSKNRAHIRAQQTGYRKRNGPKRQSGPCEICGKDCELVWDHDHSTDAERGYLCNGCNLMLGHAYDNPDVLRKGAEYLGR